MRGAVLVAAAAALGNMIQGWDNACIAGAVLYIKKEFNSQNEPTIEGLIVAMSLIGATLVTTCSGAISDSLGRRPMLIISSILYFLGGLVMLWSPNVYILLLGRLLDGFGIGLAVTLVPVYISETSPPEIRGSLNTLPQFMGSGGMFLSYCMVFAMSLMESPSWRLMLGVVSIPSLGYFVFTIFFLPESPRWLVSKGRMLEAKHVLQRLRGKDDVSGEMALLVEGLGVGEQIAIEEFIVGPANDIEVADKINLYGHHEKIPIISRHIESRPGSFIEQSVPLMDPLVTLFDSVHGSKGSALFPHFESMLSVGGDQIKQDDWDEEESAGGKDEDDHHSGNDSDDNLRSPLISRQTTGLAKDMIQPTTDESVLSVRKVGKHASCTDIAGEETRGSIWSDLCEPGVKHALFVGIGLQILQQFSGINGVLYYTPQILEEAGVGVLLSNLGISSTSSSLLISNLTTLLMLPCIVVAMRLMDISGRRTLLLTTIPVLILSLIALVIGVLVNFGSVANAAISTASVVIYICCFVMGFGPIPNILCSEIFPTRVRGICIAICALTFWICDIIVTYSLPLLLTSIGLPGVFGFYAVVCIASWAFVFLKVPETKGMPLEVITEFFSVGAKHIEAAKHN
ncbi:monosaccharide-sensing protein 2-like [Rutidosis leptorrhynchoides]|uniref:monosaccharide-sensing protein 2-like n=1 Tax=Rutidosis leptorrhynchoides TaxID=125765 RepID=UPI003A9910C9